MFQRNYRLVPIEFSRLIYQIITANVAVLTRYTDDKTDSTQKAEQLAI
jgi:hypothetical protein